MRPFLRWAGSKRQLVPTLLNCVPPYYNRYVEPFCGSACLFFALRPESAILSDINSELINFYRASKEQPQELYDALEEYDDAEETYYRLRSVDSDTLPPLKRAVRFAYLNRYSFNGVYRTNRRGQFNVPRGRRTGSMPSRWEFYRCALLLRRAELLEGDFEKVASHIETGDFVYLDPPYFSGGRKVYGEYGYGVFSDGDLNRLIRVMELIDRRDAYFVVSYKNCPRLRLRLERWLVRETTVRRHVAGFAKSRGKSTELIISNYKRQ